MNENWRDEQLLTTHEELHEGVAYHVDLSDIENLVKKAQDLDDEAAKQLTVYQNHMNDVDEQLWRQLEERDGKIVDTNDYIVALAMKDDEKMKTICYRYFNEHRALRRQWRLEKRSTTAGLEEERDPHPESKEEREEERQTVVDSKQRSENEIKKLKSQRTQRRIQSRSSAAAASTEQPELPPKPTRAVPIPPGQGQEVETTLQQKTPKTPSKPVLSPRLRLDSHNFHIKPNRKSDHYYEKQLLQEMMQRSYIKYHPTSGYSTATPEMKRVYDGYEVYNFDDVMNPWKPVEDSDYNATMLQELLAIGYHYAPTFFDTMKQQKLDHLRKQNWEEEQ
eukprot:1369580-Amphidinium_carterae.4